MKILGTGLSGLVGSRVVELLSETFEFENLSYEMGTDITNREVTIRRIRESKADVVLHLAAKADVDGCEKDKAEDENGQAWKINVSGTKNVVEGCVEGKKRIIYISTDFVFDGERKEVEHYSEEDTPHPLNFYGETKLQGEEAVKKSGVPYVIARIAYPYRAAFDQKKDFVRAIVTKLRNKESIQAVTDHIITPTLTDDIAKALQRLIDTNSNGIFHVVGSEFVTPYSASLTIAQILGLDKSLIAQTTRAVYFKDRAARPFNLSLENDKITELGVSMSSFGAGIEKIKDSI